jgi:hypothetical protein
MFGRMIPRNAGSTKYTQSSSAKKGMLWIAVTYAVPIERSGRRLLSRRYATSRPNRPERTMATAEMTSVTWTPLSRNGRAWSAGSKSTRRRSRSGSARTGHVAGPGKNADH